MIVEERKLWENGNDRINYVMYLQDNSEQIDKERRHPAMIVCGGGAYMGICDREKEPVALEYLKAGYQVFVLTYSTLETSDNVEYPIPVYDLAKMILTIRENAEEWNIDSDKIAAVGFSAGGHLVACMATQWHEDYLSDKFGVSSEQLKLNAAVLSYPLVDFPYQHEAFERDSRKNLPSTSMPDQSKEEIFKEVDRIVAGKSPTGEDYKKVSPYYHISEKTCPIFLWATATDELVYVGQALKFCERLTRYDIPFEIHVFDKGVHGMSIATSQSSGDSVYNSETVSKWLGLSLGFLERQL
jgi:acetyl esterase/lipase